MKKTTIIYWTIYVLVKTHSPMDCIYIDLCITCFLTMHSISWINVDCNAVLYISSVGSYTRYYIYQYQLRNTVANYAGYIPAICPRRHTIGININICMSFALCNIAASSSPCTNFVVTKESNSLLCIKHFILVGKHKNWPIYSFPHISHMPSMQYTI